MPEYVDRKAIYAEACKGCTRCGGEYGTCFSEEPCERLVVAFSSAPAADVVEVKWIPVTERLPEADGEYLCYFEDGGCCAVNFDETGQAFGAWVNEFAPDTLGWCGEHFEEFQGVTHWMPLPEPPVME